MTEPVRDSLRTTIRRDRAWWMGYIAAVMAVAIAGFTRVLLEPSLGGQFPFITFILAILFVAWFGGLGPGLLATGLAAVVVGIFVPTRESAPATDFGYLVGWLLFLAVGTTASWLSHSQRKARHRADDLAAAAHQTAEQMRFNQWMLETAQEVADIGSWTSDPNAQGMLTWSKGVFRIFGISEQDFDGRVDTFFQFVHPDDLAAVRQASLEALEGRQPYSIDHRIVRRDGGVRWVHERAEVLRDELGRPTRMIGIVQDITDRKEHERRQTLLMHELDHRVKNNLAAVLSLADQSLAAATSLDEFRRSFTGRVAALARTHAMLARGRWESIELGALISAMLDPYLGGAPQRAGLHGSPVRLPARVASPLSMALHELATNAAKYGALSSAGGRVEVTWVVVDRECVQIRWVESGGPAVNTLAKPGFGTQLIQGVIGYELSGNVQIRYQQSGLECDMAVPLDRPKRSAASMPSGQGLQHPTGAHRP